MRVVPVPSHRTGRVTKQPKRRLQAIFLIGIVTVLGLLTVNYFRPLPAATVTLNLPKVPAAQTVPLAWPTYGQSSVAAEGFGILATRGTQQPLATASIAKVITALCVLEKYPLEPGEQGPTITFTEADAKLYRQQVENNGSRLYVETGDSLTEYQALQAVLLPSANNIADSLAIWAFGSLPDYQAYATDFVKRQGLTGTVIGSDASGLDPSTKSTAADLAHLGLIAERYGVFMDIVKQPTAVLPGIGTIYNYNSTLKGGYNIGIKTGNNDEDPGAFLYAARPDIDGKQLYITGAVMGGPDLQTALFSSEALARSVQQGFETYTYAPKQTVVGEVSTAWGGQTNVTTQDTISLLRWKEDIAHISSQVDETTGTSKGAIGSITLDSGRRKASSNLVIDQPIAGPSFWWRLTRIP